MTGTPDSVVGGRSRPGGSVRGTGRLKVPAPAASLGPNPRPAKTFPETRLSQPAHRASRELRWGWDGASLKSVSGYSVDPIEADINLYRNCRDNPVIYVDPTGGGMFTFIQRPLALAASEWMQNEELITAGVSEFPRGAWAVRVAGAGLATWTSEVLAYYRDNTFHAMLVVAPNCQAVVANQHVTGFGVKPAETWDFQAKIASLPRGGGWQHPAADFILTRAGGFPSEYYPAGKTFIITIVANNTFDNAVTAAANAITPTGDDYRAGGNRFRYNCVDWVVRVLARAGLGGHLTNDNPQPFGDDANVPWWVPSGLIGWVWDKLP